MLFVRTPCLKIEKNVALEFIILASSTNCLVTIFDHKFQVFKNSPKLTIFGIFDELLSNSVTRQVTINRKKLVKTENANNQELKYDIFGDFQTL